jgi:hypothetical protein
MRAFLFFVGLVLLAAASWVLLTVTWSYSEGERAGYIQKFSRKGWLCKTWEGEIAMVTMPGAIPDRFEFSVRDKAVADQINALAGQRVILNYAQHTFIPTNCFGETEYFVTGARAVRESPATLAPAVAPPLTPAVAPPAAPPATAPMAQQPTPTVPPAGAPGTVAPATPGY